MKKILTIALFFTLISNRFCIAVNGTQNTTHSEQSQWGAVIISSHTHPGYKNIVAGNIEASKTISLTFENNELIARRVNILTHQGTLIHKPLTHDDIKQALNTPILQTRYKD